MTETVRQPAEISRFGRRIAMAVLLMSNFMNVVDVTIVNVAMPSLQHAFPAPSSKIEWVVAGYIFTFALLLLPSGRMGDLIGRRRMFVAGVCVFTAASALCGLVPTIDTLIAARVLQGIGGAMMIPQTLALVPALFPPQERGAVYGVFALSAGLAMAAGPVIGGLLIGADLFGLGWRPIFLVNVPVGLLAIILALRFVPNVAGSRSVGIDGVGILLAGSTLFAVLFPLIEGPTLGWPLWLFALPAAALPLAFLFVRWQHRQALAGAPQLLPVAILGKRGFLLGACLVAMLFSGVPGFFFVVAQFLQDGFGLTPLQSGLTVLPFPLGLLCASPVSSRLGSRHLRLRAALGAMLLAATMVGLRHAVLTTVEAISWVRFAPFLALAGFGLGNTVSPLFQSALAAAGARDSGSASGAVQSLQQVGASFGVAIMGGLYFWRLQATDGHAAFTAALARSLDYSITVFTLIALLATRLPHPEAAPAGASAPAEPA